MAITPPMLLVAALLLSGMATHSNNKILLAEACTSTKCEAKQIYANGYDQWCRSNQCAQSHCKWVTTQTEDCSISETPQWIKDVLGLFMPEDAPAATILSADGLWTAIQTWDKSPAGTQKPFFVGTEIDHKYMISSFLANVNQESLRAFAPLSHPGGEGYFKPNYGINEIKCDDYVGYCQGNRSNLGASPCPDTFVQDPSMCAKPNAGNYTYYWGRGPIQVTCRAGSAPEGSPNPDFCPAYSDLNKFFMDYIEAQGWNEDTIENEPWRVAMDPVLTWGSAMVFWMSNTGHDNTGCYTSHEWTQLKNFAGTVETINGGWGGGEAPLNNNCDEYPCENKQFYRISFFKQGCEALGLDPVADGWNGLTIDDKCPCEVFFGDDGEYCKTPLPADYCAAESTELPSGYPFGAGASTTTTITKGASAANISNYHAPLFIFIFYLLIFKMIQ